MALASISNIESPAPRWYRRAKRAIGLLSGPSVMAFVQIFNPNDHTMAAVGEIIAFLPTILELFNAILTNGEEYAPTGTTQQLQDITNQQAGATVQKNI